MPEIKAGARTREIAKKLTHSLTIVSFGCFRPLYVRDLTVGAPCPPMRLLSMSQSVRTPITTIEQLVRELTQGPGRRGFLEILDRIDIPVDEFEPYSRWNEKHYTRNCIARTDAFELLLICYEPGQRTSIHDYSTEEAWVHPLVGTVLEERFECAPGGPLRKVSSARLDPGSFSYLHNGRGIHRYINNDMGRSMTLNLYARPLNKWKMYDEGSGEPSEQPPPTSS
jgi:cysteine dioxygenase